MSHRKTGAASIRDGTIRRGAESYTYRTSFSSELRFRCLPGCGLCCRTYRIPLSGSDLRRLEEVADPRACSTIVFADSPEVGEKLAFMETGKGESCCYLDGEERCSVYAHRPLYCRTYPLIRDTYEHLELSVDHTCPGVGEGDPVGKEQIEEALLLEAGQRPEALRVEESAANFRLICGSLKAMGVHTDARLIRAVCSELIRRGLEYRRDSEILSYLGGVSAALARLLAGTGNIDDPGAADELVEGVEDLLEAKPEEISGSELSEGGASHLSDYLTEWVHRQALLRFVHAAALARPRRENVLQAFFRFLVHGVSEILAGAGRLRRRDGELRISERVVREAIRCNEGPLRSRCASVVSR
jgi:Fe-S-cluster containining protein